jgi:hypothetical protein
VCSLLVVAPTLLTNFQKLIKRTIFAVHLALLIERQDVLLAQLTQVPNEGFSKAKEEWEKNLLLWGTDLPLSLFPLSDSNMFHIYINARRNSVQKSQKPVRVQAPLAPSDIPLKRWM